MGPLAGEVGTPASPVLGEQLGAEVREIRDQLRRVERLRPFGFVVCVRSADSARAAHGMLPDDCVDDGAQQEYERGEVEVRDDDDDTAEEVAGARVGNREVELEEPLQGPPADGGHDDAGEGVANAEVRVREDVVDGIEGDDETGQQCDRRRPLGVRNPVGDGFEDDAGADHRHDSDCKGDENDDTVPELVYHRIRIDGLVNLRERRVQSAEYLERPPEEDEDTDDRRAGAVRAPLQQLCHRVADGARKPRYGAPYQPVAGTDSHGCKE